MNYRLNYRLNYNKRKARRELLAALPMIILGGLSAVALFGALFLSVLNSISPLNF